VVSHDGIRIYAAVALMERLRGDVGSQHLGELVVLETAFEEFLFGEASIVVLVHPGTRQRNDGFKKTVLPALGRPSAAGPTKKNLP
jgi:hypothetical protein